MPTAEQQIAQQREAIEKAKERARQITKRQITKQELLRRTLASRRQAQIEETKRKEASQKESQKELGRISKYETGFETEVKVYEKQKAEYERQKAIYDSQVAYNNAVRQVNKAISRGNVALLAMYGEGTVKELAQKALKQRRTLKEVQVGKPYPLISPERQFEVTGKYPLISVERQLEITKPTITISDEQLRKLQIQQKLIGQEIYDPRTKTYLVSPYEGGGGTAIMRQPTREEQIKIDLAQRKGSVPYALEKYAKLSEKLDLLGRERKIKEYEKYKETPIISAFVSDPRVEVKKVTDEKRFSVVAGVSSLFWKGMEITEKPYERVLSFLKVPEDSILRKKVTIKGEATQIPGKIALWAFFSPVMTTAVTAKQKLIQKELSKTKFGKLEEFYGKVQRDLVKKKDWKAQIKYLDKLAKEIDKTNPIAVQNFRNMVQDLYERGIYKGVPIESASSISPTAKEYIDFYSTIGSNIPVIAKEKISAFGLFREPTKVEYKPLEQKEDVFIKPEQIGVTQVEVQKVRQTSWVGLGTKLKQKQAQIPKQIELMKTEQVQKQIQKQTQVQKQMPRQIQLFKQALKLKEVQIQRQQLRQVPTQVVTQIQIPKTKFPFGLGKAVKRVQKIAKEKPELFEVFGKRFGKEVKLGIVGTQELAEKKLSKFLKGTLGAAGFITKDKKKIKAAEIELLKEREFRKSKLSEFLVIEKKEKRLRKATTGKEIQFFRGLGSKKKSKSIFGI